MTALKELNASTAEMGEALHSPTVPRVLQQTKLYGRVAKRKHQQDFMQRHVGDSKINWKKVLWSHKTKMEHFGHQIRHNVWQTPNTAHHHQTHHPHRGAWWWQHHAVGMLLGSRLWKAL